MQILNGWRCSAVLLGAMLTVSMPALAQSSKPRSGEVAGVFGWSSLKGADEKAHVLFGASAGVNLSDRAQVFGEYSYSPMGSISGASLKAEAICGGIRIGRVRGGSGAFLVGAGGLFRGSTSVSSISISQSGGYYGFGGGATIFLGQNWGVRPEARLEYVYMPAVKMSGVTVNEATIDRPFSLRVSFFVQFGGK
jgi:hypothetical protein